MKIFITGTDTGVGKTYFTSRLAHTLRQMGKSVLAIKPVASGCHVQNAMLVNEDALLLQQASSHLLPYAKINPFAFSPPIAPHIAAQQIHCVLNMATLQQALQPAFTYPADVYLIEGAGGWYVPLNSQETMADFVVHNAFSVILVVGIRLGCLNHALLSVKAIQNDGAALMGWVANVLDKNMPACQENIATLKTLLPSPCLGVLV